MGWGILELAGYAAMLLWGAHMVTSGVMRSFGAWLRQRLSRAVDNPFKAFGTGLAVTLALQSSTSVGLMAASFTAEGLVGLPSAFIMMLGSNVGTALVARVLSFPIAAFAPVAILVGVIVFRKSHSDRWRNVGRIAIGFGLMLMALHALVSFLGPIRSDPVMVAVEGWVFQQVGLTLCAAAFLACLCHSSMAVILLAAAMAQAKVLPAEVSLALMLGANLGGAIPPIFAVATVAGRRLPVGNWVVRAVGCLAVIGTMHLWVHHIPASWAAHPLFVANAHVLFNVALAVIMMPLAGLSSRVLMRLMPDPPLPDDPGQPRYLSDEVVGQPHLALVQAEREALRLGDRADQMVGQALRVLRLGDEAAAAELVRTEQSVLRLGLAIRRYLANLSLDQMSGTEVDRRNDIQCFVVDLEGFADIMAHRLAPLGTQHKNRRLSFTDHEWSEIEALAAAVRTTFRMSTAVFVANDMRSARELVASKPQWREREQSWVAIRQDALRHSDPMAIHDGDPYMRALRELKRAHSQIVGIAFRALAATGQLQERLPALPADH